MRLSAIALLSLLLAPAWVGAQERIHAPANTAWARRGQAVALGQLARAAASLPEGVRADLVPGPLFDEAVEGTLIQAVVPVSFADEAISWSRNDLGAALYGGTGEGYSLSRFYDEASRGVFQVDGHITGTVTLPDSAQAYAGSRSKARFSGVGDRLDVFLRDALQAADRTTDWRPMADPNDPEHRVAVVVFLVAGPGGQCQGDKSHLWAHRWNVSKVMGKPFQTSSRAADGKPILIDDYILLSANDCQGGEGLDIGTLAHETGHLLGLPDLYDTSDPLTGGPVGHWDLMATGNFNRADSPAQIGAATRWMLGWGRIRSTGSAPAPNERLRSVHETGEVLHVPFLHDEDFLLIEYRTRDGSDRYLHGEGVLVWQVQPRLLREGLEENRVVRLGGPSAVALVQADGEAHLDGGDNRGDDGDPWPGATRQTALGTEYGNGLVGASSLADAGLSVSGIAVDGFRGEARLTVERSETDAFGIRPTRLGPWVEGEAVNLAMSVSDSLGAFSLYWSADAEQLRNLGLSLDEKGRLTGRVSALPGTHDLTIRVSDAENGRGEGRSGEAYFRVDVMRTQSVSAAAAVAAVLDPGAPLPVGQSAYLDSVGNQNGRYDLGDLVVASRRGLLSLDALRAAGLNLDF